MIYQKRTWHYAGPQAETLQEQWFKELLEQDGYILLTAIRSKTIIGFIIGKLMPAPGVYDPGGLTAMIDDFCVVSETLWPSVEKALLEEMKKVVKVKSASQIVVVCGCHDKLKSHFLKKAGLTVASEWYVGTLSVG